jgi:hypothetical protein
VFYVVIPCDTHVLLPVDEIRRTASLISQEKLTINKCQKVKLGFYICNKAPSPISTFFAGNDKCGNNGQGNCLITFI